MSAADKVTTMWNWVKSKGQRVRAVNVAGTGLEWESDEDHLRYVDEAVAAWKRKGQPHDYLKSSIKLTVEQRAEIFRAASLRHKGREPKTNPYASSE